MTNKEPGAGRARQQRRLQMLQLSGRLTMAVAVGFMTIGCGSSDDLSSGTGGAGGAGGTQQAGCSATPDCAACSSCFDRCLCQTGDGAACAAACQGAPGGSGGTSATGGSGPGSGGAGASGGAAGNAGVAGSAGAAGDSGSGGDAGGAGVGGGGAGGSAGAGGSGAAPHACTGPAPPAVSDYGARGPWAVTVENSTGPNNQYTMFRPTTLGDNGFLHPPTSWGNGVTTTPSAYTELLSTVASHGFVVIASNSTSVTADLVKQGLDWLIQQNSAAGALQGKLAVNCAVTIGYSMGGGAAVGAGSHPNVVTTVSWHGLQAASESLSGPLLLITSTDDNFVTKTGYVQPTYNRSTKVPTLMATLDTGQPPSFNGHLIPLNDAGPERAPAIAWLRYWVYGDQAAQSWFFGSDCILCRSPWTDIQRKNHEWQ